MFARYIRPAGCLIVAMTLLFGVIYPAVDHGHRIRPISVQGGR